MSPILAITLNPSVDMSSRAEVVRPTRKVRTTNVRYDPGGGGINVARVVATLGGQAQVLYLAGGALGELLDRLLAAAGLPRRRVDIDGETRIGFTVLETSTGLEYRFVPSGPDIGEADLERALQIVTSHQSDWVVASGSLPPGAPDDIYARMARAAAERGARFVLDSSGAGLTATLAEAPVFLVKPSRGELEQLVGKTLSEEEIGPAAAALVAEGKTKLVAVTLGADGALLASADGIFRVPAIAVRERSAVGAGDSFLAAMVLSLADGKPVREAFLVGVAAGAAAVMTSGTQLCRQEDVWALYRKLTAPGDAAATQTGGL